MSIPEPGTTASESPQILIPDGYKLVKNPRSRKHKIQLPLGWHIFRFVMGIAMWVSLAVSSIFVLTFLTAVAKIVLGHTFVFGDGKAVMITAIVIPLGLPLTPSFIILYGVTCLVTFTAWIWRRVTPPMSRFKTWDERSIVALVVLTTVLVTLLIPWLLNMVRFVGDGPFDAVKNSIMGVLAG